MKPVTQIGAYTMRPIEREDLQLILNWRNSPFVHDMMLTDHQISWEEHLHWYEAGLLRPRIRNFIFSCNERPLGCIGYTYHLETDCICDSGAFIGDPSLARPEAALYLMVLATDYAFQQMGMKALETTVFKKNRRALKLNYFIGYHEVETRKTAFKKNNDWVDAVIIRISKEDWRKKREQLMKIL